MAEHMNKLVIDNARLIFKNFSGKGDNYILLLSSMIPMPLKIWPMLAGMCVRWYPRTRMRSLHIILR